MLPPRRARQPPFVEGETDDGGEDAQEDVDGIVVSAVDGCPPDAEADDGKHHRPPGQLAGAQGIEAGDGAVGGMERWHGGENVGVVDVDAAEDGVAYERIEASEARGVAARIEERFEAELLDVPWRCCGVDVVADETDEVDEQEGRCEAEGQVSAAAGEKV